MVVGGKEGDQGQQQGCQDGDPALLIQEGWARWKNGRVAAGGRHHDRAAKLMVLLYWCARRVGVGGRSA